MSSAPYLGLDIGLRRTGVALSENGLLAQPLTTLSWEPPHTSSLIKLVKELVAQHSVVTIVAGVPLGENDEPTAQALKTVMILDELEQHLDLPLVRVNEFHSTQDAAALYPSVDKDAAAAAILLQDYLDSLS